VEKKVSIIINKIDGGPQKWVGQKPDTEASGKELIRELLYVFFRYVQINCIKSKAKLYFLVNFNRNLANSYLFLKE
jgi:hypothetical protein